MSNFRWSENGESKSAFWRSENGADAPAKGTAAEEGLTADAACRLAREGKGMLWRGDFQNARLLLQAMMRRVDRVAPARTFAEHREAQARRARLLGMLLLPFDADHRVPLRRAPDVRLACTEVHGAVAEPYVSSLRELQGILGAHEWRKKGVEVPALRARIHPHYGVFAPIRGEYADLVAKAPLPSTASAFDIGTGTGVLAAILGRRGVQRIVATDLDPRAVACARDNLDRLGLRAETQLADLFPEGRAALVVCNPPWIPAEPTSSLERAVYDPDNRMLLGFLAGLAAHLEPGGEGWLVLSDLAERLGLRTRAALLAAIEAGGLQVVGRIEAKPAHPRAADRNDPLHAARAAEVTSLWRLKPTSA